MEFAFSACGIHINYKYNDSGISYICKTNEHFNFNMLIGKYIVQIPQNKKNEGFKNIMTFEAFKNQVKLVEGE